MNPIDDQLYLLFRSAQRAAADEAMLAPPFGLETRVLAAWRQAPPLLFWDPRLLIRGLVLSTVIMGLSLWSLAGASTNPFSEYLQLADSTIQLDNTP